MSEYGKGLYGRGRYGGSHSAPVGSTGAYFDLPVAVRLFVYDRNGTFKTMLQSGSTPMLSVSFKHGTTGCVDFAVEFSEFVAIDKSDKIRIKLFGNDANFFTGVVRSIPIQGSTSQVFTYTGYGLNDYFVRINCGNRSYTGKTLTYIVHDLVDTILLVKSMIQVDYSNVVLPNITVTQYDINYLQLSDVLDALKKIADSSGLEYNYGVDKEGYFFFKPRSTVLQATLLTGKRGTNGIESYEPSDEIEQKTKLHVLRKDTTFYTTINSSLNNDIWEEKIVGPEISDNDLLLWATGQLYEKERYLRSAQIEWGIFTDTIDCIVADGFVRILSNVPPTDTGIVNLIAIGDGNMGDGLFGGELNSGSNIDDTLSIKEIQYTISTKETGRKLTLGALPLKMETMLSELNRKIANLES